MPPCNTKKRSVTRIIHIKYIIFNQTNHTGIKGSRFVFVPIHLKFHLAEEIRIINEIFGCQL